jgi:hypothetical protein
MNLITHTSGPVNPLAGTMPVSLTIRPACGLPDDYVYPTDSAALFRLLAHKTDLPASVLQRFKGDLYSSHHARLLGVELSERVSATSSSKIRHGLAVAD